MLKVIVFRLLLVLLCLSPSIFEPAAAQRTSEYSAANPLVLEQDVEGALARAASNKRDLLIIIMDTNSPGCRQIANTVLVDKNVQDFLNDNFETVRLDAHSPTAAFFHQQLGLAGLPAFVLTAANKSVKGSTYGAPATPAAFIAEMKGLAQGQPMKGWASRTKTTSLDPDFVEGGRMVDQGEPVKAIECYGRAIKSHPDLWDAYLNRGTTYYALKRYPEALKDLDRAILLNPKCALALVNKANVLDDTGRQREALPYYGDAIKIDPEEPEAYYNRALVSLKLKESASAKKDLKRAAELYSAQGNKRFALQALSRLQRLEESGQ